MQRPHDSEQDRLEPGAWRCRLRAVRLRSALGSGDAEIHPIEQLSESTGLEVGGSPGVGAP